MPHDIVVYADGGSRGNPGPAGYGAVVYDATEQHELATRCAPIGEATNNVAEYRGLIAGLEAVAALDTPPRHVTVKMDSKLVVEQMSGRWKIKHPDMQQLAIAAKKVLPNTDITYQWVPRADNSRADELANDGIDGVHRTGDEPTRSDTAPDHPTAPTEGTPVTIQPAAGYAGDIASESAWQLLNDNPGAILIDVRTAAEWTFVGTPTVPDHSPDIGFVQWQDFPSGQPNPQFVDTAKELIPDLDTPVLCLCRSGARSAAAATLLTASGYTNVYNIADGFEGPVGPSGHRDVSGWRAAGLPWRHN